MEFVLQTFHATVTNLAHHARSVLTWLQGNVSNAKEDLIAELVITLISTNVLHVIVDFTSPKH